MRRDWEILDLLDSLRYFNITGSQEAKRDVLLHINCLIRFDNSINERTKRILESNGFKVEENYIVTKKGNIEFFDGPVI